MIFVGVFFAIHCSNTEPPKGYFCCCCAFQLVDRHIVGGLEFLTEGAPFRPFPAFR